MDLDLVVLEVSTAVIFPLLNLTNMDLDIVLKEENLLHQVVLNLTNMDLDFKIT